MEDINFSLKELGSEKEEDSIIFYMQKIYPGCCYRSQFAYVT